MNHPYLFAVYGVHKEYPDQPLILRRFETEAQASAYALAADMNNWNDIWVKKVQAPAPNQEELEAPTPWHTEHKHTFIYIRDANNKRVLSLHGVVERRQKILSALSDAGLLEETK